MSWGDGRSTRFAFVPFCTFAQAFHARGLVKEAHPATIQPVVQALLDHDLNLVQMPCPESTFGGLDCGLNRDPHGLKYYDTDPYRAHCWSLAGDVLDQMEPLARAGYEIALVLGIEYSPSCTTSLLYTNRGTVKRPGLFAEAIQQRMADAGITAPYIGINKRGLGATLRRIEAALTAAD